METIKNKLTFYIDIDNTICITTGDDYEHAKPLYTRIARINKLYKQGHLIVFYTARGSGSGIDWRELTEKQLNEWGVLRHSLQFGKPVYDVFIDDKAMSDHQFFK